jgi:hypothetical protein
MNTRALRQAVWLLHFFLFAGTLLGTSAHAAGDLKVMRQGLGTGTVAAISGGTINCGATCDESFPSSSPMVTLRATPTGTTSAFVGWGGDCAGTLSTADCVVSMTQHRNVRAEFRRNPDIMTLPMNPTLVDIQNFLANPVRYNTPGDFVRALDPVYKQGWILMTRSESLQPGTARLPRVMLPGRDAQSVFTVGLGEHGSYPGAHHHAIEMMQWDPGAKTFRFHEIVLEDIPAVSQDVAGTPADPTDDIEIFPFRARGLYPNEPRCTRCHSTRNIHNPNPAHRGTSIPTGTPPVIAKNKPNWDTYDSWGGAMPFNRDRIYQGSVEAAAFRKILNPWSWRGNAAARQVMEQLELQPPMVPPADRITRVVGGERDGTPVFDFDGGSPPALEPTPASSLPTVNVNYSFDNMDSSDVGTPVVRQGPFLTLHEPATPTNEEGRAVQFFDRLGGAETTRFNQIRVGHEIASHRFATGGVPLDARPVALAIVKNCLRINADRVETRAGVPALTVDQAFFRDRHRVTGPAMGLDALLADTTNRAKKVPVRKVNIQKLNLDRAGDVYLFDPPSVADDGLIGTYGGGTMVGTGTTMSRLRQEIFRREFQPGLGGPDDTPELEEKYVDREDYSANSEMMTLFRFFLEPLGVSVDKWSMGVRGRSRTYSFADIFNSSPPFDTYKVEITRELQDSLSTPGDGYPGLAGFTCPDLINAINTQLAPGALPTAVPPTFTDVQRVFNKGCIECHGGLGYPPFTRFMPVNSIDFSEEENPASSDRLLRSHGFATSLTSAAFDASNRIWTRITAPGEDCGDFVSVMPCGGPPLTGPDIDTIRRWIDGGRMNSHGDPHIQTIDGTNYDFQSAGEFTLLRGEAIEVQARHTPVEAAAPLPPNGHTGLTSCPSISTAAAIRVGPHRITYQPNLSGQPDPEGMQLRIDGKLVQKMGSRGIALTGGGRILPTTASGGIQIEYPGGTDIVLTPNWWSHYQLWYLNIDVRHARGNFGVMGVIAPRNWLPALPDNSWLGPRPASLLDRFNQIYGRFADAWRVTNRTSLFDYAAGTSTSTFTLRSWPAHQPTDCKLPPGWARSVGPQKPIAIATARQICAAVVNRTDFDNCVTDVAVTGEAGFAQVYVKGEKIQRNALPKPPGLEYPRDMEKGMADTVDFAWGRSSDSDGGKLTYTHCVWAAGEKLTYPKHCKDSPPSVFYATAAGLRKDTLYYWKVVVDDAQGGTVDSEVRRFRTK